MSLTNTLEGALPLSIYTVLKGEHKEVSALFTALEHSPESLETGREATLKMLRKELLAHAKAEETAVYDRLKQETDSEGKDLIKESEEEHAEIEARLNKLLALSPSSDEWMTELKALKDLVEHHVQEEEGETFEDMKSCFSDEEAEEMAKQFHELKKQEMDKLNED